jgi:hypothetical protein
MKRRQDSSSLAYFLREGDSADSGYSVYGHSLMLPFGDKIGTVSGGAGEADSNGRRTLPPRRR